MLTDQAYFRKLSRHRHAGPEIQHARGNHAIKTLEAETLARRAKKLIGRARVEKNATARVDLLAGATAWIKFSHEKLVSAAWAAKHARDQEAAYREGAIARLDALKAECDDIRSAPTVRQIPKPPSALPAPVKAPAAAQEATTVVVRRPRRRRADRLCRGL